MKQSLGYCSIKARSGQNFICSYGCVVTSFQQELVACLLKAGQYLLDDDESKTEDFLQMPNKRLE